MYTYTLRWTSTTLHILPVCFDPEAQPSTDHELDWQLLIKRKVSTRWVICSLNNQFLCGHSS